MILKNKLIQYLTVLLLFVFIAISNVVEAQTVEKPTFYDPAFSDPCTGNVRTDDTAAMACVKKVEEQGRSLGYDISCDAERATFPGGFFFNNTCTINGVPGFGAELLAGYEGTYRGEVNEMWWTVDGSLNLLNNPPANFFVTTPTNTVNSNAPTVGTMNASNTLTNSSNYASSLLNTLNKMVQSLKSQLSAINTGTAVTTTNSNTVGTVNTNTNTASNTSSTSTNTDTSLKSKIMARAQIDGQVSFSADGCTIFNVNLTPGTIVNYNEFDGGTNITPTSWSPNPSTGSGVLALRHILQNPDYNKEGFLIDNGGLTPDEFGISLFRGLYAYQKVNKIPSDTTTIIYDPDTLIPGPIYATGIFDTVTREFVNAKCYKINA